MVLQKRAIGQSGQLILECHTPYGFFFLKPLQLGTGPRHKNRNQFLHLPDMLKWLDVHDHQSPDVAFVFIFNRSTEETFRAEFEGRIFRRILTGEIAGDDVGAVPEHSLRQRPAQIKTEVFYQRALVGDSQHVKPVAPVLKLLQSDKEEFAPQQSGQIDRNFFEKCVSGFSRERHGYGADGIGNKLLFRDIFQLNNQLLEMSLFVEDRRNRKAQPGILDKIQVFGRLAGSEVKRTEFAHFTWAQSGEQPGATFPQQFQYIQKIDFWLNTDITSQELQTGLVNLSGDAVHIDNMGRYRCLHKDLRKPPQLVFRSPAVNNFAMHLAFAQRKHLAAPGGLGRHSVGRHQGKQRKHVAVQIHALAQTKINQYPVQYRTQL